MGYNTVTKEIIVKNLSMGKLNYSKKFREQVFLSFAKFFKCLFIRFVMDSAFTATII